MTAKVLTKHHLEFLSLKGGCSGSAEPKLVKMPHCRKPHVAVQLCCTATVESCSLFILMDYPIHTDTISMELSILYLKGLPVKYL